MADKTLRITDVTPLFGEESVLISFKLIELCLILEDMAEELGFEFDWIRDAAISRSCSMFRTAGTLASEFINQMNEQGACRFERRTANVK